jgi:elongation factor 3
MMEPDEAEDEDADAEDLCNCKFTLAYGTKILLHNTKMRLKRGKKYGLLGGNDSGKTTLMRAIANGSVEGFPDPSTVRTVFVEADIQGEQSHLSCIDYVLHDERIKAMGISREQVTEVLASVGFTMDGKAKPLHAVSTLSGGWRMKLAMARAMLQRADILLLDEPTNHLDVINVAWVKNYINSLTHVTAIMVSHDSGFLNECCTHIMAIQNLKLEMFKGNLNSYVETHPHARSFFELKASKLKFSFPQPGPIEGIKSKGRALMKMSHCDFTYPGNTVPTLFDITVQVSLASRVACVGENGAGKSTMIKVLTGEVIPQTGEVWRHPNARVAYLAQHAFHHIENHMQRTPNEYIRWRYANGGEDKESLVKVSMICTEEEEKLKKTPFEVTWTDEATNKPMKAKVVVAELLGNRRQDKSKEYLYEVRFAGSSGGAPEYQPRKRLEKQGWAKNIKAIDARLAQTTGLNIRPLSSTNVEAHLGDCGLAPEFATHTRIGALSGGQKVKVVLAAAMWNQPHILILDEPTNYLDRESLGALAGAIEEFQGGVVIISHNNEFVKHVCPEEWVMDAGRLETRGDAGWMERQDEKISDQQVITEVTDAAGNVTELKQKKKLSTREKKALIKKLKQMIADGIELESEDEEFATENGLYAS